MPAAEFIVLDGPQDSDGNWSLDYAIIENGLVISLAREFPTGATYVILTDDAYLPYIQVIYPEVTLDTFRSRFADDSVVYHRYVRIDHLVRR